MLSLNEIRDRALAFVKAHQNDSYEKGEAQTFWNEFFDVFGIDRKRVAAFEQYVHKLGKTSGFIDCFWPGTLLIEHKSYKENLEAAYTQALDYFQGLTDKELPKYVLVSDFQNFRLYEVEKGSEYYEFSLADLPEYLNLFHFLTGREKVAATKEDPVNIKASKLMAGLHDKLKEAGYAGHDLEVFLVRVLFLFFSDDSAIFEKKQFERYLKVRTAMDGSDLGSKLHEIFEVLNTPIEKRQKTMDEELAGFPYVNGGLFQERIRTPAFNSAMRETLLHCSNFNWSRISPAIFGSLFQYVMDEKRRRDIGAHYTDEKNILKIIKPLFLDALWEEFEQVKRSKDRLWQLQLKLSSLKFLDPACGCGNFLVITYRELRRLELEILKILHKKDYEAEKKTLFVIEDLILLNVDQFYGIEIEEFPAKIAEVSMWLMDHQMNYQVAQAFGHKFIRIPLTKSAAIRSFNATQIDWNEILRNQDCSYIIGNPPYYGSKFLSAEQKQDAILVMSEIKNHGVLDYVSCWFVKAAKYIQGTNIKVGFVSTNSITQGEQVGILWKYLIEKLGISIHFAHQTFKWDNQASAKAQVFVVIIGFGTGAKGEKLLYEYANVRSEPVAKKVKHINAYLIEGPDVFVANRSKPICDVPEMSIGNKPIDGGNYLFTPVEKKEFITKEPSSEKYFRKWIGSQEFINGEERWCLWLGECSPSELRAMPEVMKRIEAVQAVRLASESIPTKKLAEKPTRFHVEFIPNDNYLVMPEVSSEKRAYIPIGFMSAETLPSNLVKVIPNSSLYHFGILTSRMHMAWTRYVCGRMKGDYRYSSGIVYNNFPWPENASSDEKSVVEESAQTVLACRQRFNGNTLADLYDPLTMPPELLKCHQDLDKVVDRSYRKQQFISDSERVEFLFQKYKEIVDVQKSTDD